MKSDVIDAIDFSKETLKITIAKNNASDAIFALVHSQTWEFAKNIVQTV